MSMETFLPLSTNLADNVISNGVDVTLTFDTSVYNKGNVYSAGYTLELYLTNDANYPTSGVQLQGTFTGVDSQPLRKRALVGYHSAQVTFQMDPSDCIGKKLSAIMADWQ